jgi:hypothetical protein
MLRSVNPYVCPILGVCAHQAQARVGGCMIIVSLEFDGHGAAFSILEIFHFANSILALGLTFFFS